MMNKFDGLILDSVEPRGVQRDGIWRRYRGQRGNRLRLERCIERLGTLFAGMIEEADSPAKQAYRFEIEFLGSSTAWRKRLRNYSGRRVVELRLTIPHAVQFIEDAQQLETVLRRWLVVAIMDKLPELPTESFREPLPLVPLLLLSSSISDRPDQDELRYARVARLLADLSSPLLIEQPTLSSWPVLQLAASRQASSLRTGPLGLVFSAPVGGASVLSPQALVGRVSHDFQSALNRRAAMEGAYGLEALADRLRVFWQHADHELLLSTSIVRREGGAERLRLEYREDLEGERLRPVVESGEETVCGPWQKARGGIEAFSHLEPNVNYRWRSDGHLEVNTIMLKPSRRVFDMTANLGSDYATTVNSESDGWALIAVAHESAAGDSILAIGEALCDQAAHLSRSSLRTFGRCWANWKRQLNQESVRETASATLGFVSSDVADDLHGWIILQGQDVFSRVCKMPSELDGQQFAGLDDVEDVIANLVQLSQSILKGESEIDSFSRNLFGS